MRELNTVRPPYRYKTAPKGKQLEAIENTWHERIAALLCRPGTGKTKMGLDTAGLNYMAGNIEALLVIAPNGVHRQWVEEGIPTHLPESIPWLGGYYSSGMGKRKLDHLDKCLRSRTMGLRVLCVSFEGAQTKVGQQLVHDLVAAYRTLVIVDESHRASNTKGGTWKALLPVVRAAEMKRIATGTLLRQNPFSAYGQFELMGDALLGFQTLSSFKSMYAEMLPPTHGLVRKIAKDFKEKTGRNITPQIQARDENTGSPIYRNLADLRTQLARWSVFLTLADVNGTEPTVTQSTRLVQLTREQRTAYDDLKELGVIEFQDRDEVLTADTVLALSTRLAQIAGGFAPSDDDPEAKPIGDKNPKLEELLELVEEIGEKVVIWCRFQAELKAVSEALRKIAPTVEYHGRCSDAEKNAAKRAFIDDPSVRFFVGQVRAGGTGLDGLQAVAQYMVFFSNDYPYLDREQAIARLARTGAKGPVMVFDIMAEETVDFEIVRCLQNAQDVTSTVLQRNLLRKWL